MFGRNDVEKKLEPLWGQVRGSGSHLEGLGLDVAVVVVVDADDGTVVAPEDVGVGGEVAVLHLPRGDATLGVDGHHAADLLVIALLGDDQRHPVVLRVRDDVRHLLAVELRDGDAVDTEAHVALLVVEGRELEAAGLAGQGGIGQGGVGGQLDGLVLVPVDVRVRGPDVDGVVAVGRTVIGDGRHLHAVVSEGHVELDDGGLGRGVERDDRGLDAEVAVALQVGGVGGASGEVEDREVAVFVLVLLHGGAGLVGQRDHEGLGQLASSHDEDRAVHVDDRLRDGLQVRVQLTLVASLDLGVIDLVHRSGVDAEEQGGEEGSGELADGGRGRVHGLLVSMTSDPAVPGGIPRSVSFR